MTTATQKKAHERFPRFQWVVEVLIFAIVTPALIFSVLSLQNMPVA